MNFLDGPAKGAILSLHRSPVFLRVVIDADGTPDALDQLDDVPRPSEKIHVYILASEPTWVHYCRRGGRGGREIIADYRLYENQPTDAVARDFDKWNEWTLAESKKIPAKQGA